MKWLSPLFIISGIIYFVFAFYLPRENFYILFTCYASLFIGYGLIIYYFKNAEIKQNISFGKLLKYAIGFGILLRIVLLFSVPTLTDDFYRFYWDGLLNNNGISPFEMRPSDFMAQPGELTIDGISGNLYHKLNSPHYYSIYPPLCQFVFSIGAWLFPKSVFGALYVYKFFMLLFELASLYFLLKLIPLFKVARYSVLLYWLNPLVIIELSANIHFEAGMIMGLLGAIYYLTKSNLLQSTQSFFKVQKPLLNLNEFKSILFFTAAVLFKMLPLMFLPLLIKRLGFFKMFVYGILVITISVLAFSIYINPYQLPNLFTSIKLYFSKFEFNASIYYLARYIGYIKTGYNQIAIIGPALSKLAVVVIMLIALFSKNKKHQNLPLLIMLTLIVYLLSSVIVHPWYIAPLIALCALTNFKSVFWWSFLITLSYSHYHLNAYTENYWLISLEYSLFSLLLIFDLMQNADNQLVVNMKKIIQKNSKKLAKIFGG